VKEAGMILLQTIPDTIDIESFQADILKKFPQIQSIHDLHIWQLTQSKFVSTAHIIFKDPSVYKNTIEEILNHFHEQDINIVTIQPEFQVNDEENCRIDSPLLSGSEDLCLVACQVSCEDKVCCKRRSSESSLTLKGDCCIELEHVVSVRNVSLDELNRASISDYSLQQTVSVDHGKIDFTDDSGLSKIHRKISKAVSVCEHNHHNHNRELPAGTSDDEIHIVSFKRVVSESVIKHDEHDELGRNSCEILVENKLMKQIKITNNSETEDIYTKTENTKKCDS
jgi:hypothetical protein